TLFRSQWMTSQTSRINTQQSKQDREVVEAFDVVPVQRIVAHFIEYVQIQRLAFEGFAHQVLQRALETPVLVERSTEHIVLVAGHQMDERLFRFRTQVVIQENIGVDEAFHTTGQLGK